MSGSLDRFRDDVGRLWCAVACESLQEPLARREIAHSGMVAWWPHYATTVTRRIGTVDRRHSVLRGLFAGYLLAGVDEPGDISVICGPDGAHGMRGVADVVRGVGGALFILPAKVAEWRNKALNADGLFDAPDWADGAPRPAYKPGERVKLTGGHAFAGFMAEVKRVMDGGVAGDGVLHFELEELIFGTRVKGTADACQVERVT